MSAEYQRLVFLFVDGVGLAPAGPTNPLETVPTPAIDRLLGGALTTERLQCREGRVLTALDAALGVDGLPQSATGQTTIFTGVNAAAAVGRHVPALPGPRLRRIIGEASVFATVGQAGRRVTFANAYGQRYLDRLDVGEVRASATTLAIRAAEVRFRLLDDLAGGRAVTFDVCGDLFARRAGVDVDMVDPAVAGRRLARIAVDHHLTLFETFVTDLAGHRRWGLTPAEALRRLDGLIGGLVSGMREHEGRTTLVLTSDHGNLEDDDHRRHTRNPVPLLALGPAAERFADLESIVEVASRIADVLGVEHPSR